MSRRLQTRDIFAAVRCIKSIGIREELKTLANKIDKNTNINEIGIEGAFIVLEKATEKNSENLLYEFLSGPLEVTTEEVASMDPLELVNQLKEVCNLEGWKTFLFKASQLMK